MADRDEMLALAERCEQAAGPDRELDCLIGAAINLQPEGMDISAAHSLRIWGLERFAELAGSQQNIWRERLPRYTASLDAAMTLVPEGHHVELERWADRRGRCEVRWTAHTEVAWAATPALALCAAALRTRASVSSPSHTGE